jgi:ribosomal protein S9
MLKKFEKLRETWGGGDGRWNLVDAFGRRKLAIAVTFCRSEEAEKGINRKCRDAHSLTNTQTTKVTV